MVDTARIKDRVRAGIEAINNGDAETLRELVADDVIIHGQGEQEVQGLEAFIAANTDNSAFPDQHLEIEQMVAEGDTVAVRMRFTGTHNGEMEGLPATGEEIDIRTMGMYRANENGELTEAWVVEDDAATLQQLGIWEQITEQA